MFEYIYEGKESRRKQVDVVGCLILTWLELLLCVRQRVHNEAIFLYQIMENDFMTHYDFYDALLHDSTLQCCRLIDLESESEQRGLSTNVPTDMQLSISRF